MVHLAPVKKDSEALTRSLSQGVETLSLDVPQGEDAFYSSVYGSRFAVEQLPSTEMPEKEMPRDVAYRMIKDELSLDGNPMLKYDPSRFFNVFISCGDILPQLRSEMLTDFLTIAWRVSSPHTWYVRRDRITVLNSA